MTEAEWLGSDNPWQMFDHLQSLESRWSHRFFNWLELHIPRWFQSARPRGTVRKLYLLACGLKLIWGAKWHGQTLHAAGWSLEESFADRQISLEELLADDPKRHWHWPYAWHLVSNIIRGRCWFVPSSSGKGEDRWDTFQGIYAEAVRDVFGNPFRPLPRIDVGWLVWNSGTVRKLAHVIYEDRAFDGIAVLADALEDAGCDNADILTHLRGPGPHVRGCWVVDALLRKE